MTNHAIGFLSAIYGLIYLSHVFAFSRFDCKFNLGHQPNGMNESIVSTYSTWNSIGSHDLAWSFCVFSLDET